MSQDRQQTTEQMALRAVVVGCGWIGSEVADDPLADGIQSHAAAYSSCPRTRLAGVCDVDLQRAQRAARRWDVEYAGSDLATTLAQEKPHIVSICTPDATHGQILREVLHTPGVRAVIVEKPLTTNLGEARELVDLAAARKIILAVNYLRRFSPSHIDARRRISAGELGRLVAVRGIYTKGVMHNGTHWFDLARWIVGDIVKVQAGQRVHKLEAADPTCDVRMIFRSGERGYLLGLDETHFTAFEMEIIGTRGRLRIVDSGMNFEWSTVAPSPYYSGYSVLTSVGQSAGSFKNVALRMVENVVSALDEGSGLLCSGEDGIAALAVAHAAHASLAKGIEITPMGIE